MTRRASIAGIAIGRNEGARLQRCLTTLGPQVDRLIYVDSGSRDDSVALARSVGATVVALDTTTPFTAARARNAGAEAALAGDDPPDFLQFIDGDCGVEPGWVDAAAAAMAADPTLGLVTGWRSEIDRDASVYNAMCDVEWHRPAGPIIACGGDMMVRSRAFQAIGGFDPTVIAAEDDEFCLRLGKAGFGLIRLPLDMTRHDAAMTRFSQWWQRSVRGGHAFAQIGDLHPAHQRRERLRVWIWGGALPLIALAGLGLAPWLSVLVALAYGASWLRTAQGLMREGQPGREALHHAAYLTISKFPNLIGMLTYHLRRARGATMRIIEYK